MIYRRFIVTITLALLLSLPSFGQAQTDADWTIDLFASDLVIESTGLLAVTETINVNFSGGPHHGIYRDIPLVNTTETGSRIYMNFDVTQVQRDGVGEDYQLSREGDFLRIRIGDEDVTIQGVHQYLISYEVSGALQSFDIFDELTWDVTGDGWNIPITQAVARVSLPSATFTQQACYTGPQGSTATDCTIDSADETNRGFATTDITSPGENFTIAVGFAKGMVPILIGTAPADPMDNPRTYQLFGLIVAVGFLLLLRHWWQYGRDEILRRDSGAPEPIVKPLLSTSASIAPEFEPPEALHPGEIGVLLDEVASPRDISATIVDLAVRGYLTIERVAKKHWFGSVDYIFHRTKKATTDLLPYENQLLATLFVSDTTSTLSKLKASTSIGHDIETVKSLLYQQVKDRQLFAANPQSARTTMLWWGGGLAVPSFLLFVFLFEVIDISWMLIGTLMGLFGVGLLAIGFALIMPKRTVLGSNLYRRALGYKLFLSQTEKYRQPFFEKEGLFMTVLPYAMVFGITGQLVKAMERMGVPMQAPAWYVGTGQFSGTAFASELSSMSSAMTSTMSSASSSGGGGSAGGGGGGGGGGGW